ncbi:MAG: prepilin-type N-terminal cleavage/methylation domain-containing protein, partial [Microthrixaceae bacterium]
MSAGTALRRRSQSGLTLVEVVLAVALTLIIVAPLTAWLVLSVDRSFNGEGEAGVDLTNISLNLKRDIPSAAAVRSGDDVLPVNYTSCADLPVGFDPTDVAEVRFVVDLDDEDPPAKVEYIERVSEGVHSLWRHKCTDDTAVAGLQWTQGAVSEISTELEPLDEADPTEFVRVRCEERIDDTGSADPCGLVTVDVRPSGSATSSVTQEVRYDSGAAREVEVEVSDGEPIPRITSTPATSIGFRPFTVAFSSATSENLEGA